MSGSLKRKATRPWLGVATVALGAFVVITTEFLPIGLLGLIASDLRVSAGVAGLLVAMPGAVAAVAAPLFTVLAGKVDRKLLLLVFLACVGLSNAVAAGSLGGGLLVDHAGIPSAFLFGGCLSLACALLLMRSAPLAFMDAGASVPGSA